MNKVLSWLSDFGQSVIRRLLNLFICVDQLIFCLITLGSSSPDETLSAAAYRLERAGKLQGKLFRPLIDTLLWFDKDHCRKAHEAEVFGWQDAH